MPLNLTIQQVLEEIKIAKSKKAELDTALDSLLATRKELEAKIDQSSAPIAKLRLIRDEAERMAAKISVSSVNAVSLSSKVRKCLFVCI